MQRFGKGRAFTLIELLIVVAIIAILALIAVPNFLEAQVRAKVSRVKADMRSIATAEEAYMVDWNTYTYRDRGDDPNGHYVDGFRLLTSPVAYMTNIPHDAFGGYQDLAVRRRPMFEFGSGNSSSRQNSGLPGQPNPAGLPADTFLIRSTGPDRIDDTSVNSYPWTSTNVQTVLGQIYDPTNGTVSSGDVYRTGGVKPSGPEFDVLFQGASR